MEQGARPIRQQQRRLNPTILDVVKKEVTKLLVIRIIYPISGSQWVSLVQVVPKKSGMIIMKNQHDELVPMRIQNSWQVCIDYKKLNQVTRKDHFPLPLINQVLEKLAGKSHYCFLDGFSGYMQIYIAPKDQHKTTFTCPFGTFAYTRMLFGLCNAPKALRSINPRLTLSLLFLTPLLYGRFAHSLDMYSSIEDLSRISTRLPYHCLSYYKRMWTSILTSPMLSLLGAEDPTHIRTYSPSTQLGVSIRAHV
ncbi:hypothetical protein CR513_45911, partial [Mucuna pruriens]